MTVKLLVPRDTTALSMGADPVAAAIQARASAQQIDIELV